MLGAYLGNVLRLITTAERPLDNMMGFLSGTSGASPTTRRSKVKLTLTPCPDLCLLAVHRYCLSHLLSRLGALTRPSLLRPGKNVSGSWLGFPPAHKLSASAITSSYLKRMEYKFAAL
jgi:hypothetical protein